MPLDLDALKPVALWREANFHEDGSPGWWNIHDLGGIDIPESFSEWTTLPAATFTALVEELRVAREALAFYADAKSYDADRPERWDSSSSIAPPVRLDCGRKARAALQGGAG